METGQCMALALDESHFIIHGQPRLRKNPARNPASTNNADIANR
jgi:hypothetical protein